MPRLRQKDQKSEVLLAILCSQAEQRPGAEAETRREMCGVPITRASTAQLLLTAPTQQATRSISTD